MKNTIDCAAGRKPCDLVIKNVKICNVFTGELETGEIAVCGNTIVGIGTGYDGKQIYDGAGRVAIPGLVDSHIHVESSMLSPEEFASLAVPHGTSGIVADPHEIVNVCGVQGAEYMHEAFARLSADGVKPLDVYLQLPSCVPATPFDTSGATVSGKETREEIGRDLFFGLGEMMNYPAVIGAEEDCLEKLAATREHGKPIDGHAPAVTGKELCAYLCGGIRTDHESMTDGECLEKIARGMYIQIRNGSSTNNIKEAARAMNGFNFRRFVLCSDDKNARDLAGKGHLDDALRKLVDAGVPPVQAVCTATINSAECYGLNRRGAIAPDYFADIVLVDDLQRFNVSAVFKDGKIVAENGKALFSAERYLPENVLNSMNLPNITEDDFRIRIGSGKARAMTVQPHSLVTKEEIVIVSGKTDVVVKGTDLCKIAVLERHFASGNIGLGLLKGYGLHGAAMGITVAHDSHNVVVLGDDNALMARAVSLLKEAGGGMAFVSAQKEEVFPLDIAGLMSSESAEEVIRQTESLTALAKEAGVKDCYEPFMTLAFMSLAVLSEIRLTDQGLVDVTKFAFTTLEVS